MSTFVLDCSVAMRWLFRDEATPAADALYAAIRAGHEAAGVPALFFTEPVNALLTGERAGRCRPDEADRFLQSVLSLQLGSETPVNSAALADICRLARAHLLTSYDAAYLELAIRTRLPLATFDQQLRAAAAKAGVTLLV